MICQFGSAVTPAPIDVSIDAGSSGHAVRSQVRAAAGTGAWLGHLELSNPDRRLPPQRRSDTLYAAAAAGMEPGKIRALKLALHDLAVAPRMVLMAATDADKVGDGYVARLSAMAQAARVPFERIAPPGGVKDWNDYTKQ